MKKVTLEILGIFIFLIGSIFFINYFSGITGYVVVDEVNPEFSSVAGIVFIVGGLMIFIAGKNYKTSHRIPINEKSGIAKIKIAIATKIINYEKLKRLVVESGYKFVEAKDYTTIFSPKDKVIKDDTGYPIIIRWDKKKDKEVLIKVLRGIVEDYNSK